MNRGATKDKANKVHKISGICVAVAAVGLFLIDMTAPADKLSDWGVLRITQVFLACMATVCGLMAAVRKGLPKWHNVFNAGAVLGVVWSLVLALFLGPRELTGWNLLHGLQLTLLTIAAVSACGVAYFEVNAARKRKEEKAEV